MSTPCPCCERTLPQRAERHGLMVQSEPWRVFWQGVAMTGLAPMRVRFLFLFLRSPDGSVAASSLDMFLHPQAGSANVKPHITTLRKWLAENALPFTVKNVRGWGYRLVRAGP